MVKELHMGNDPVLGIVQVRHSNKSPKTMSTDKEKAPKTEPKKPVITFYKNTEKSEWVLYPQVYPNEKTAKEQIRINAGAEIVKCIDVPEELQNG